MIKLIQITMVTAILVTSTLALAAGQAQGQAPAVKGPTLFGTLEEKHCEKCKRGPDGKMVCEPVPCPK